MELNRFTISEDPTAGIQKLEQTRTNIENATTLNKVGAFFQQAANDNFIAQSMKAVTSTLRESTFVEDAKFKESLTADKVSIIASENGIGVDEVGMLYEAKNKQQLRYKIIEAKGTKEKRDFIQNTLTDIGRASASVTGSLVDLDTLVVGPLSEMFSAGASVSKVAKTTFALEGSGAVVKSTISDDYNLYKDGALDITIGVVADTAIAKFLSKEFKANVNNNADNIPSNHNIAQEYTDAELEAISEESRRRTFDIMREQRAAEIETERIRTIQENISSQIRATSPEQFLEQTDNKGFMDWYKEQQRVNQVLKDSQSTIIDEANLKAEERALQASQREADRIAIETKDKELAKALEREKDLEIKRKQDTIAEEADINAKLLYYQKQFSSPKYDTYKLNRQEFFDRQRGYVNDVESQAMRADKKLQQVQDNLTNVKNMTRETNARIKELEDKLSSGKYSKSHTNNIKREINAKKEQLASELKQLDEAKKDLSMDINTRTIDRVKKENRTLENMIDDIAVALDSNLDSLAREIKDVSKSTPETKAAFIKEHQDIVDGLIRAFPDKANAIKASLENLKVTPKGFNLKDLNNLNKKQKAAIMALSLVGTSAMASDSEDGGITASTIMMTLIAAVVVGPQAIKALTYLKNTPLNQAIKDTANKISEVSKMSEYRNSDKGNKVHQFIRDTHERLNTAFNNTLQEVRAYNNPKLTELFEKLLYDPINGSIMSMDVEKTQMVHAKQSQVDGFIKQGYKAWKEEQGVGFIDDFTKGLELRERYNKLVSDAIEGIDVGNDGIKAVANNISKVWKTVLDDAIAVDVKGANQPTKGNYLPRLWDFTNIGNIISGSSKLEKEAIQRNFANMIVGSNDSFKTAGKMMDWFTNVKNFDGKQADDVLRRLEEFLKDDINVDEAKDALSTKTDMSSRLKARLDMDLTKWKDIEVNGKVIKLDDLVERDVQNISDRYLNQMYGQIGLAKRGWKTESRLRDEINTLTEGNKEAADTMNVIVDLLMGYPLHHNNKKVFEWTQILKGFTFFKTLPIVGFSMIPEMLKTVSYTGLPMALKNIGTVVDSMNKNSELFKTLTEMTGLGTQNVRHRMDFKGIDTSELADVAAESKLAKIALKFQETTAILSGLTKGSEVLQRLSLLKSSTDFALLAKGLDNDIPLSRLEVYGIDDKAIQMFKDDFNFTNGQLDNFDPSKWDYNKRVKFNDIMFRMNQDYTPEVVLGTIGRWTKDNALGNMFSFLLSYPLNVYSNQAVRDAHLLDQRALTNTVLTFAGAYIGLTARAIAQQKEVDHEQNVMYALMNLPSMGVIGAVRSVTDPAAVGVASKFKDDIDAIASLPFKGN